MRFALLILTLLLSACASRSSCEPKTVLQVPTAPPAPLEEVDSQAPIAPGMTWIAGHWHWDDQRWVWSPGNWASTPPGQRWYPPRYNDLEDGRHSYRPGAFGCIAPDDE